MADIIDVSRGNSLPDMGFTQLSESSVSDITSITSSYYLRLEVVDKPGVMADVTSVLGKHDVSIEALIQKDARPEDAQIVIVTNDIVESSINAAIAELTSLDEVTSEIARIRVANLA